MSILIKGMAMPKNCDECRIMTYEDTNCISVHELFCGCPIVFRAHPQHEEHRPDYCPLVEVKPHGRLIDADAFRTANGLGEDCENCHRNTCTCNYDICLSRMDVCGWVDDAPTIIEAEPTQFNNSNALDALDALESEGEDG